MPVLKRFVFDKEEQPGAAWLERFIRGRDEAQRWYLGEGRAGPPTAAECRAALRDHMPELLPHYDRVCGMVGDDGLAHCILSHYRPAPLVTGCSQAVWLGDVGPALVRNYDSFQSPTHFKLTDLLKKFDKTFGATKSAEKGKYGKVEGDRTKADIEKRRADRWNFLFVAGMWFQDLFNYDFRRTEMCIIPYATQQGEISFCAYNTGVGWRNIIEKMHMTATLTKWYEEHGRHEIFAGGKEVNLSSKDHSLVLNAEAVAKGKQTDLDDKGIAKNAREEKLAARKHKTPEDAAREAAHNAEMAKLYAQHVLKEQPTLQIQGLGGKKKASEPAAVLHKPVV